MINKKGLLLNIAVGDSVGRSYEFATAENIEKYFNIEKYTKGVGKFPDGYEGNVGLYTDDTQMSIAVAEHILENLSITNDTYVSKFLDIYNRDNRVSYSKRTLKLLKESKSVSEFNEGVSQLKARNSNGPVMRCLPLGLYNDIDLIKKACFVQSTTTHHCVEPIIASQAIALTVHYLYYKIEIPYINWMYDKFGKQFLDLLYHYKLGEIVKCNATETASFCLHTIFEKKLLSTKDILSFCIKTGGDTDSTAAICLGLASLKSDVINDLNDNLYTHLENGKYGRDYLMDLDKKLNNKFA